MEGGEDRRVPGDPVALAAALRGVAIELRRGSAIEPERLVGLLEAAATALAEEGRQGQQGGGTAPPETVDRLAGIKRRYPRAYEPWTPEEDRSLRRLHEEGQSIEELVVAFRRQPSAITSRLRRLGLDPPTYKG